MPIANLHKVVWLTCLLSCTLWFYSCYDHSDTEPNTNISIPDELPPVPKPQPYLVMYVYTPDSSLVAERMGWNDLLIKNRYATWNETIAAITAQLQPAQTIPVSITKEILSYNSLLEKEAPPTGVNKDDISRSIHLRLIFDEGNFAEVPTETALTYNKSSWDALDPTGSSLFLNYMSHAKSASQETNYWYQYGKLASANAFISVSLFEVEHLSREDRTFVRTRSDMISSDVQGFVSWYKGKLQ